MNKRISVVNSVNVKLMLFGSILQVGDSRFITPRANVFAVHGELPYFDGKEDNLSRYPLYTKPIPKTTIIEPLRMKINNESPYIQVGNIKVNGISTSAIVQIGSNHRIDVESRVKHVRILLPRVPKNQS
ncbi:spore germination protein GerPE [Tepidibacillus sp. HK-1]|uniref:spore germination protein GerPE n=1 Tax=Tepidibacillus sp. HK-1 TaxID=1883407 RepID=UPI000853575E|nr:spore germination protein GerPE [Tepidibacillus sp. HK-1]GBF10170.1 putative spore germination protein GerPE [Tepidibacillus sp. HK-1]